MEVFDALTPEDKETIKDYISIYAGAEVANLHITLNEWNKSKRTLYKALGYNLRVKIPIEIKKSDVEFNRELSEVYNQIFPIYRGMNTSYTSAITTAENNKFFGTMTFVDDFILFFDKLKNEHKVNLNDIVCAGYLLNYDNIQHGYIKSLPALARAAGEYCFKFNGREMTIKPGQKIMKTIQKVLNFYGYDMSNGLFEEFRNKVSNITTCSNIKSNLVLSIHPIDYMTMSDNNCEWSSCMSWMNNGMYSDGTIEMMNSNMVVVAYLESDKEFIVNNHIIPNKSWRTLLYVHKNILVAGKSYPYYNSELDKRVLAELYKLVNKNLKWDYKYKEQEYRDLYSYLPSEEDQINIHWVSRKQIVIVTGHAMYNDLLEDKDGLYLCYRNIPKKGIVLNASGKNTCLICGLQNNLTTSVKICNGCKENYKCHECNNTNSNEKHFKILAVSDDNYRLYNINICEHCIDDYWWDTINKMAVKKGKKPIKILFYESDQVDKLKEIVENTRLIFPSFTNISILNPSNIYGEALYEEIKESDIKYVEYSVYFDISYMFPQQTISFEGTYQGPMTYFINNDNVEKIFEGEYLSPDYISLRQHLEEEGLLETSNSI